MIAKKFAVTVYKEGRSEACSLDQRDPEIGPDIIVRSGKVWLPYE